MTASIQNLNHLLDDSNNSEDLKGKVKKIFEDYSRLCEEYYMGECLVDIKKHIIPVLAPNIISVLLKSITPRLKEIAETEIKNAVNSFEDSLMKKRIDPFIKLLNDKTSELHKISKSIGEKARILDASQNKLKKIKLIDSLPDDIREIIIKEARQIKG